MMPGFPNRRSVMIVVRDIFRVKFGQAKEATALWKQALKLLKEGGFTPRGSRLLTDLVGPSYYTFVLETNYDSLAQWQEAHSAGKDNSAFREVYQRIIPLTEDGRREILSVIE